MNIVVKLRAVKDATRRLSGRGASKRAAFFRRPWCFHLMRFCLASGQYCVRGLGFRVHDSFARTNVVPHDDPPLHILPAMGRCILPSRTGCISKKGRLSRVQISRVQPEGYGIMSHEGLASNIIPDLSLTPSSNSSKQKVFSPEPH